MSDNCKTLFHIILPALYKHSNDHWNKYVSDKLAVGHLLASVEIYGSNIPTKNLFTPVLKWDGHCEKNDQMGPKDGELGSFVYSYSIEFSSSYFRTVHMTWQ